MSTSRHREFAVDVERDPRVRAVAVAADDYAVKLRELAVATAACEAARVALLAAVERAR